MEAGKLRHRVEIQYKVVTQNSYGEEEITWTELATVWAAVEPLSGREFLEGRQVSAEVNTRIRIRRRGDVTPEMRVVYGSINYDILAVIELEERRREEHLMCQEIVES